MILADTALAARIERAEACLSMAFAEVAIAHGPPSGAFSIPLGRGAAVFAGPDSPVNKVIGIGFDEGPLARTLDEVERRFFERGSPVQAEVATLASPGLHSLLTERGYLLQGFEDVLGLALSEGNAIPDTPAGIAVETVPREALAEWMDVVISGFEHPDATGAGIGVPMPPRSALEQTFGRFAETLGFHPYIVRVGNSPAAGAGLRFEAGIAQLCGAATLPAFRRRGIQTALLRRRLRDARLGGCDFAVMTAQPGSKSHFNAQRQGFELLYSRAILVRVPGPHPAA